MGDATVGGTTLPVLDALLLDAKLAAPLPSPTAVSRAALIDAARADDCCVVAVTAPAGYGKSTLLGQWALAEDRRVAWVSLDRFDDDPAMLLTLLAAAYARISGDADVLRDVGSVVVSLLGRAAPRLASAFRSSPCPFVLMLDDLHELRSPECHDALSIVMSGVPPGSQFVAASRAEQPHVPRLRAMGGVRELTAADLALDVDGAEQVFSNARVTLSREAAEAVTQRTEGWPVGLYLAAVIASVGGGDDVSISGDDRYVADYLYRESTAHMPEADQRFLRRTAVLDQLCAPLCDELLGEPGAQDQLHRLEESNTFLLPLDRRRQWYRYHGLFREFLLAELRRLEPEIVTTLHERAADWYLSNGSPATAVEHLLQTDDRDRCVRLVASMVHPTYQLGHLSTVKRWLAMLGDEAIASFPPLAIEAGWMATDAGQVAAAARWADIVDTTSLDQVPADVRASFESRRAMWRSYTRPTDVAQVLADAAVGLAHETPTSPRRDLALAVAGEAHLLAGDIEAASDMFSQAAVVAAGSSAELVVVVESELALLAIDAGRWHRAAEHLERAMKAIDEHRMYDYASSALASAGAARLAAHRGDIAETERQASAAMRTRSICTVASPILAVRVRLHLARVYWASADSTTTRQLLVEIEEIMVERPALGMLADEVASFREAVASSTSPDAPGAQPLSAAELRLLPYLQTHLTAGEIAVRLFVSRNTVRTQTSAIYRKLGVSSRSEAVALATTMGLLGG